MRRIRVVVVLIFSIFIFASLRLTVSNDSEKIIRYIVDSKNTNILFFLHDENGKNFKNIGGLKAWLDTKGDSLIFSMNGGMYNGDLSPQGLYIEKGKTISPVDTTRQGYGNFYMYPNGIFYISHDKSAGICKTEDFIDATGISFATQSGPLLVFEDKIHPKFKEGSQNINIRNGVGILPNGKLIFAISSEKINFYDFANFFKSNGCKYALYLDGFVSKAFIPTQDVVQLDGTLGVIIAQVSSKK